MLKPEAMCRVSIVGPKSVMKRTIDALHGMKILHIDDFYRETEKNIAERYRLDLGTPLSEAEAISASLVRLRSVSSHLPRIPNASGKVPQKQIQEKQLGVLENEIMERFASLKELDGERAKILAEIRELEVFEELPLRLECLADYKSLSVFVGYLTPKTDEKKIRSRLAQVSSRIHMYFWAHDGRRVMLAFAEHKNRGAVLSTLLGFGYAEINTANIKLLKGTAMGNLRNLVPREEALERARARLNSELADISRRWLYLLEKKESELVSASERAMAPLRFAVTSSTFIAEGWVPSKSYAAMVKQLELSTKGRVYIEQHSSLKNAPVELKHPRAVEPFEFFMNLYSLPRYTEIDPTFFMFLTFPLFFGMMLGDIGYGFVTAALFLFLRKKSKDNSSRALLNVMLFASIASIIFGFVFGEFFGEEAVFGVELPRFLNRVEGMQEMIYITAGIGILQLNLGYLLGFFNKLKEHGFVHALLEKGSWFMLEAGIALIAANYLGYLAINPYIGWAAFAIAILMLLRGEGIKGVVEIPALLSNTLSYTRIMAVGLASVSLALVVNEFAGEFFHMGGIYMLIAVIILVLGHSINLALGIMGPFLHSLRLHYVEFFTKFFDGGGKEYKPFGRQIKIS